MHFLHNEVSSEAIRGYLRQGTQIEQLWQQVDEKVTELTLQGMPPWDAYSQMSYPLAFVRACRLNIVLVQKLLEGADPTNSGYIPRPTYDQAQALGELFEPFLEEAIRLLDPRYSTHYRLPFQLRRVQYEGRYSAPHLLGVIAAGRETREWSAGLLAQYDVAIAAPKLPIPQPITGHLAAMKNQLALGDFHLESAANLLGGISDGKQIADATAEQADNLLWEAMESFYQVSQLLAYPRALTQPAPAPATAAPDIPRPVAIPPAALSPGQRAQIAANVSDLLGQLHQARPSGTPAPASSEARDLLQTLQMKDAARTPAQPAPDAADLLNQLHLTPPAKSPSGPPPAGSHQQHPEPSSTDKKVADLLADLGGDQHTPK